MVSAGDLSGCAADNQQGNTRNSDRMRIKKENQAMRRLRNPRPIGWGLALSAVLAAVGCTTPMDLSKYGLGPAPLREPSPAKEADACCYEDSLTGGQIFTMYCSYCHNAPALAERPFSNFRNVAAHMRVRANLTGKEYTKLLEFLRRWHDVPPPHPSIEPPPKRFFYSQPIPELRPKTPAPPAPKTAQAHEPQLPAPQLPDEVAQPAAGQQ